MNIIAEQRLPPTLADTVGQRARIFVNARKCENEQIKMSYTSRCPAETDISIKIRYLSRTDSFLQATKLPLTTWFLAFYLIGQAKTGISSLELSRHLGVN